MIRLPIAILPVARFSASWLMLIAIAALLLLLLLPSTRLPAQTPASSQPARDWARTVGQTADGAYVIGNPRAPHRLTEYISYTCPHCAHFVAEASAPLQTGWVRRGLLSVEIRNAVRDPYDLTAAMLARCGGRTRFYGDHVALFLNQSGWLAAVQKHDAMRSREPGGDMPAQLMDIADATGLTALLAKRGLSAERQKACLSDRSELERVVVMTRDAWDVRKIGGTPSFALDGRLLDASDWQGLQPALPRLTK